MLFFSRFKYNTFLFLSNIKNIVYWNIQNFLIFPRLDSNKKHSFVQGRLSICMPNLERNIEPKYNQRFRENGKKILITKHLPRQ